MKWIIVSFYFLGLDDRNSRWMLLQVRPFYLAIKGKSTSTNWKNKTEKWARKLLTWDLGLYCCILTRVGIWELLLKICKLHSNALLSWRRKMKIRIKAPKRQKWNINKKELVVGFILFSPTALGCKYRNPVHLWTRKLRQQMRRGYQQWLSSVSKCKSHYLILIRISF